MNQIVVSSVLILALAASVVIACHHSEYERDVLTEQINEIAESFSGQPLYTGNDQITDSAEYVESVTQHNYDYNGDGMLSWSMSSVNGVATYSGDYEVVTGNHLDEAIGASWSDPQNAVNQLAAFRDYVEQRVQDFSNMTTAEWMDPTWAYDANGSIKDTWGDEGFPDGVINSDDTWTNSNYKPSLIAQLEEAIDNVNYLIDELMSKYGLTEANPSGWQIGDRDEWSGEAAGATPEGPVPTVVPPTTTGTNTATVAEDK